MLQSSAKPADGASKATGRAAIFVHTSQSASGSGTCAYWMGRPCLAIPAQISSGVAGEPDRDEPRMPEEALDDRRQRPEENTVAGREARRRGPVLGPRAVVAGTEGDGDEARRVVKRAPRGEAKLDRRAAFRMRAAEARGQGRRVVGDNEVARPKQRRQIGARRVAEPAARVDGEKLRLRRARAVGGDHAASGESTARFGKAAAIASISSAADCSGRFSVAGSASGTASA